MDGSMHRLIIRLNDFWFPASQCRKRLYFFCFSAACAADSLAIGTRNGEHDT